MAKTISLILGSLLLVSALIFGYNKIVDLERANTTLTNDLKDAKDTLMSEVERSNRVEETAKRLEKNDVERQKTLRSFERKLNTTAKSNAQMRTVLDTVIPRELLSGLHSFQRGNATAQQRPGTSELPDAPANTTR